MVLVLQFVVVVLKMTAEPIVLVMDKAHQKHAQAHHAVVIKAVEIVAMDAILGKMLDGTTVVVVL